MPAAEQSDTQIDARNTGDRAQDTPAPANLLDIVGAGSNGSAARDDATNEKPSSLPDFQVVDDTKDGARRRDQAETARLLDQRIQQARNAETSSSKLAELAGDQSHFVRSAVAKHANTSRETLSSLAGDRDWRVRQEVAANPNSSREILEQLMNDPDARVREKLAGHPNISREMLERLANDPEWQVRSRVAQNDKTSPETLAQLASDPERLVRGAAAANANTPKESLETLARERDIYINIHLAQNPRVEEMAGDGNASPEILSALAGHSRPHIQLQVAANPNTSFRDLANLALSSNTALQQAVLNNPALNRLSGNHEQIIEEELSRFPNLADEMKEALKERISNDLKFLADWRRYRRR